MKREVFTRELATFSRKKVVFAGILRSYTDGWVAMNSWKLALKRICNASLLTQLHSSN